MALDERLARLDTMSSTELKAEWVRLTASPVPRVSPKLMRLALAWEIQASMLGGLSRRTRQTLDQLAAGNLRTTSPPPGTRLVREWQGKVNVVTIGEDQVIRWEDKEWRSLSEVARAITGTRWSGPAFFGLRKNIAA